MSPGELNDYREHLRAETALDFYLPRRFSAATIEGGADPDLGFQWRGVFREREPKLEEILKHPRLVVLGEPGAGKSLVARAAVSEILKDPERIPVFTELKQYRGDLRRLLESAAPRSILGPTIPAGGDLLRRTYIFDGVDEIPQELLAAFGVELQTLLSADSGANVVMTSRQAFYVSQRSQLPQFPAAFHILDFSDDDIRDYLDKKGVDTEPFLEAVRLSDAEDEIRNPFVLSVMVDRFAQAGQLSNLRSRNLGYIIDRLIQSRPLINQHRQRRALSMLAVALETYCRNELSGAEALLVVKQSMQITDEEASVMLSELHASILKRTANGFAFQMRSYGEYLAAEALEDVSIDRLRELAFFDYDGPNESWINTVGYLAEMNRGVRKFFAINHPFWMLNSSPAVFSDDEKTQILRAVLKSAAEDGLYIYRHPRVNLRRLGRFLTPAVEAEMRQELSSQRELIRGNALVVLSLRQIPEVLPLALDILSNRTLDVSIRQCAVLALLKAGKPQQVFRLIALVDPSDPLDAEILDTAGALTDESGLSTVLPLLLAADGSLGASIYHFRQLRSREALIETLRFLAARPSEINRIRAEAYLEPILKLLPKYWDDQIAEACVAIVEAINHQQVYPDNSGIAYKLFRAIRDIDVRGTVARRFLEDILLSEQVEVRRWFYVDQLVAELMTVETAQWLIDNHAVPLIKQFSPYLQGPVRDRLRPFSDGLIDAQEENSRIYAAEQAERENKRKQDIALLKERIASGRDFRQTLTDFYQLSDSHWAELSADHKSWLAAQVSKLLIELDLVHSIVWTGDSLRSPAALHVLLKIIDKYELKIDPDTTLVYATMSWDESLVADYYRRNGLSPEALEILEALLTSPPSPRAAAGIVGFLRDAGYWSPSVKAGLTRVVRDPVATHWQIDALHVLVQHDAEIAFLDQIAREGVSEELRRAAFAILVERQHRPTIERALAELLEDDQALRTGEARYPAHTSFGWIMKVNSDFAVAKLVKLRARTFELELPTICGLVTESLVKIDRSKAAKIIRRQIPLAPLSWRQAQRSIADEQERTAKVEITRQSPFERILGKLKGATSIRRLKLWCEGSTDVPVFKALLAQVPDTPEILYDFVGGWPALRAKDPNIFQHGCNEAIVVMDGDEGRRLNKPNKPLTDIARDQVRRFEGLPVELHVLQRYGIENYFPQVRLEAIAGRDLSPFYPIPDEVSVCDYLRIGEHAWWDKLKRFLVSRLHFKIRFSGRSLYTKGSNERLAQILVLDTDLPGTDLSAVIHHIAERARALADG